MRTDVKIGVAVGLCFVIAIISYYMIGGSDPEPSESQNDQTQITRNDEDAGQGSAGSPLSGDDSVWPGMDDSDQSPSSAETGSGTGEDARPDIFGPDEGDTEDPTTPGPDVASTDDPDDVVTPRLGSGGDDTDTGFPSPFGPDSSDPSPGTDDGAVVATRDEGDDTDSTFDTGYRDPWSRAEDDADDGPASPLVRGSDTSDTLSGTGDGSLPTDEYTWHEVRENETLSSIAKSIYGEARYYRAILEANPDVEEYNLRPGKRLRMPPISQVINQGSSSSGASGTATTDLSLPAGWKAHKIASGDLLGTISQKYYGSTKYWQAIQSANPDVNPRSLTVGKVLKIPPPEDVIQPSSGGSSGSTGSGTRRGSSQPPIQVPSGWKVHVVQEGDMLSTISQKYYGTSRYWGLLQDKNPEINPNNMQVGQQVRIPPKPAGASAPVPVPSGTARSTDMPRSTDPDEYRAPMPDFGG